MMLCVFPGHELVSSGLILRTDVTGDFVSMTPDMRHGKTSSGRSSKRYQAK